MPDPSHFASTRRRFLAAVVCTSPLFIRIGAEAERPWLLVIGTFAALAVSRLLPTLPSVVDLDEVPRLHSPSEGAPRVERNQPGSTRCSPSTCRRLSRC